MGYGSSTSPAVGISNYFSNGITNVTTIGSINEGSLTNCILTGNLETELAIDTLLVPGVTVNFDFKNCLIKAKDIQTDAFYQNILWNNNPNFADISELDFSFETNSILNGNGIVSSVITDIFGNPRNNPPDIGAIEVNLNSNS